MNRIFSSFLVAVAFIYGIQLTACSKKSDSGTTSGSFSIPSVTGAVATTSAQSLGLQTVSEIVQESTHVLVGGTGPASGAAQYPFSAGQMHFTISKLPDVTACLVKSLVNNGLVSKDGTEYVFDDTDSSQKTKISVTASGNIPSSFKVMQCSSGTQTQYIGGDIVGEDVTFTFKNSDSGNKNTLTVTGKFDGSKWTSKQVTIYSYTSSGSQYSVYRTTQYADALVPQFTTSGIKMYAKYALTGSTVKDYAMGAGSIKYNTGSSDVTAHWDAANLADTSTASSYAADVAAGSYLTAITSFTSYAISGAEAWDCQTGSATTLNSSNVTQTQMQAISKDLQACMGDL